MPVVRFSGKAAMRRRNALKKEFWPDDIAWLGHEEVGFFCGPRTLLFVLRALRQKAVSGDKDPGFVYLELLANHRGQGVVELDVEEDHAFAAGHGGVRYWRDRMKVLSDAGFIRAAKIGSRPYAKILLVHPTLAMHRLRASGKVTDELWNAYRSRQIIVKESSPKDIETRSEGSDTSSSTGA